MTRVRVVELALLAALAVLAAGCERSMEQAMEELASGKTHERPLKVVLATEPASVRVGGVTLKAEVTDAEGKPLGAGTKVRVLYWKAYQKVPSAPEELVREAPHVVLEGDRTYRARVKLESPGAWKVAVKVERPEREPTAATFTLDVRG